MPAINRTTNLDASVGGTNLGNAFAARVSLGYDMNYGTCAVDVAGSFPGGGFYDDFDIVVNGEHWFSGILTQVDYTLYPQVVTLSGRGRLWRAEQARAEGELDPKTGLLLEELTGGPASDQEIVSSVLDRVGLGLAGGSIGGTGVTLGTIAPEEFAWRDTETALSYIQRIDQISLGYRTFESTGGSIFRSQISVFPDGGSDMTFTQGEDIIEAQNSRSVQEAYTAVRVTGYAVGDFLEPRVYVAGSGSNLFAFNSPMIERRDSGSTGSGQTCQAVANYFLDELSRVLVKMRMTTPRNDNIGPGQVHSVNSDRLDHGGPLWVQRVDKEYRADGAIRQTMTYIGAG